MSDPDFYTLYFIITVPTTVIIWSIVLADTRFGRWMTGNPISRRYILPAFNHIKNALRKVTTRKDAHTTRRVP